MTIMKTWGFSILPELKPALKPVQTRAIADLPVSNPFPFLETPQLFKEPVKLIETIADTFQSAKVKD